MALKTSEPPVRKSFLIGGAAIVTVAVVAFALSTFVFGRSGSSTQNVAAPSSSPSVQQPGTSDGPAPAPAQAYPKNVLKPGGADPFSPKVSGAKAQAPAPAAPSAPAAEPGSQPGLDAVDLATLHTWQLLDFEGGKATFLVDGKKHAKLSPGDEIVQGYTYNSVTGECVTVKKGGASVFGLCPGAAPFAQ